MRKHIIAGLLASVALGMAGTAAQADITITYPTGWEELMEPAFKAFEEKTGEKVIATVVPKDLDQRITVDFAGGAATDVVVYDSYRTAEYTESGYLADLTNYSTNWADWSLYFGSLKDISTINGEVRGVPVYTDVRMLWYNRAILEKAGVTLPWEPKTWADILDTAEQVKNKVSDVEYPIYFPVGTKLGEATTMQGFYMALLGADGNEGGANRLRDWDENKWIGDSPAIRKVLNLYQDIFINRELSGRELYYTPDVWGDMRRAFANGNIAIMANGSWEFGSVWRAAGIEKTAEEKSEFMAWTPFPGDGSANAPSYSNISGGWNVAVAEQSEQKDLSWQLIETILEAKSYAKWVAGQGRVAVRTDALEADVYQADAYLAAISPLVEKTTGRDTFPGYSSVSAFVQQATTSILEGLSVDEAVEEFKANLVDEFGEEEVKTIK
ncbi:sugar ABC transporter substrate-binding protein [Lentilitoribacter sp. EG35]|uniref:sugar ABC transporter substrate-binding protein n=1 Tax=Lentilitoribacter sp. EG35 TaxID=3234192 RepID=UPI0034603CE8